MATRDSINVLNQQIAEFVHLLLDFFKHFLSLVLLESQLALNGLLKISRLLFVCAILIVTSWIFLMSFFQIVLRDLGVSPLMTPAILFFINLLLFGLAKWRIKRLHKNFLFNATRRQYMKMGDHT